MTSDLQPPGMRPAFKTPAMMAYPPAVESSSPPPAPATEPSPDLPPVKRGRGRPRTVTTESDATRTPISTPGSRPLVHDPVTGAVLDPVRLPSPAEFDELLRQDDAATRKRDLPKIDAKIAVRAGVVAVGMVAMVCGWAVKRSQRGTATLRKPTKAEASAIAKPLADILGRHVTKGEDMEDLFSIADIVIAIDDYLDNGPLLVAAVNPGQIPQMRNPQEM